MNTRCVNCKKMLYRTDPCKGTTGVCRRIDGGSKKMSGGSSAVEQRVANPKAESSTPSPRSKPIVGRPKDGPAKKSTAARKDVPVNHGVALTRTAAQPMRGTEPAGTQAPPVDFPVKDYLVPGTEVINTNLDLTKRGTPRQRAPKGTFDRKAYHRELMRRKRAEKPNGA